MIYDILCTSHEDLNITSPTVVSEEQINFDFKNTKHNIGLARGVKFKVLLKVNGCLKV